MAFVDDHKERFGVEPVCRVLSEHGIQIAANSYYAHKKRPASARSVRDARVLEEIVRVHTDPKIGRGLYGVRKVHAALAREGGVDGRPVSRRQVERLMRTAGLQGARRGKKFTTTRPDPTAPRPPDLVNRDFTASAPNRLWVVDYTYVPTWAGMAFTAFVSDVFSRRIVGWRTAASMLTALPLDALEMALWTRQRAGHSDDGRLDGLVHHSDAGSQYTSIRYRERVTDAGAVASIGTVGDSYDNAQIESLIGLYKLECVHPDGPWRGVDDLELATLSRRLGVPLGSDGVRSPRVVEGGPAPPEVYRAGPRRGRHLRAPRSRTASTGKRRNLSSALSRRPRLSCRDPLGRADDVWRGWARLRLQ